MKNKLIFFTLLNLSIILINTQLSKKDKVIPIYNVYMDDSGSDITASKKMQLEKEIQRTNLEKLNQMADEDRRNFQKIISAQNYQLQTLANIESNIANLLNEYKKKEEQKSIVEQAQNEKNKDDKNCNLPKPKIILTANKRFLETKTVIDEGIETNNKIEKKEGPILFN